MRNFSYKTFSILAFWPFLMANASNIPQDARKIDQIVTSVNSTDKAQVILAGDTPILTYEKQNADKLNISCREVIYEWSTKTNPICVFNETGTTERTDPWGLKETTAASYGNMPMRKPGSGGPPGNNFALTYYEACQTSRDRNQFHLALITGTNLVINVYCAPRPESQKFIMSVEMTCEKNPTIDCIKMAQQFDQIVPTTSRNVGRPN